LPRRTRNGDGLRRGAFHRAGIRAPADRWRHLTWAAAPLKKGSNFCHGTGGNAFALLKLYKRTGDALWLERARAFAARAIAQMREASREHGRGRYSLWTGDPGLAACLWSCVTGEPQFPGLDVI
jgi:hypothetical protein